METDKTQPPAEPSNAPGSSPSPPAHSTSRPSDAAPIGKLFRLPSPERMAEMSRRAEEQRLRDIELDRRRREAKAANLLSHARIPARHAERVQFSEPAWQAALDRTAARLGTGCLIALLGPRGTGKTQLSAELIRRSCAAERSARYITAMELFIELRSSYRRDSERTERDILDHYADADLLVLDELHERGESEWEDRLLGHLLDVRYSEKRDTVVISNLSREEFAQSVGPSIVSRMRECGVVIACTWASFRKPTEAKS